MTRTPHLLLLAALLLVPACDETSVVPVENPDAMPQVAGLYDYRPGQPGFGLAGTITFEQEGDSVRVTNVAYNFAGNRPLVGEASLIGNRLDITLVPENGDLDYEADVTFLFSDDGETFAVSFADTNADQGSMGSFLGRRLP